MKCIVTGAAGFVGCNLVKILLLHGHFVYAVVRPGSKHNSRLLGLEHVKLIEMDSADMQELPGQILERCDIFFHLSWQCPERDNFAGQYVNVPHTVVAVESASRLGCKRFVCTGSQAEYGIVKDVIREDCMPKANNAYGAAKLAALFLSKCRAEQLGIEWIWGRIFSVYGRYEPAGRLFPYLYTSLIHGEIPHLSSAEQIWDYLYAEDAAEALLALGERGRTGEIYNVANGAFQPLRDYVEKMCQLLAPNLKVDFGSKDEHSYWLQPSVVKIKQDTGWQPKVEFADGVHLLRDWYRSEGEAYV